MTKSFGLLLLSSFLALTPTGCASSSDDNDIETVPLRGNGQAGELDFLDAVHPSRGNLPSPIAGGTASVAITRWIDVTRCTTYDDFNRGEVQSCPGHPSMVTLRLLDASCDDAACSVASSGSVPDGAQPIVLHLTTDRTSVTLRVRVEEVGTGVVHEDWTALSVR